MNVYDTKELQDSAFDYFDGDSLASSVWINKYALKHKGAYTELSPDDTLKRIAKEISRTENKFPNPLSYDEIYSHLKDFGHFIMAGSILFGAGNKSQVSSLGNCFFVDNNADSYGAIFNMDETMAQLMKRRGGVGITIENLRPASAYVNNSAQSSTGAVSFMDRFSHTTREVAQDGRRGALMISMHVNHPDIAQFIEKKDDLTKVTGANVSIKVTDDFMNSVEEDKDYILSWPTLNYQPKTNENLEFNKLFKNEDGTYIMKVKAKEIWDKLVFQAHKNAEPGVLFWDNIINESPADCYSKDGFITKGTNPCITGDALIKTLHGEFTIPEIEERMKFGPIYAQTFNETTKKIEYKEIEVAQKTKENANIIEIETEDGELLKLTPDHKVYTENRGWVEAAQLSETDILILIDE